MLIWKKAMYTNSVTVFPTPNLNIQTYAYPENTIKNEEEITVSVDVTNKGNKDGKETVLMFVNDVISSVLTPTKQLKGFEKVFIKAGETVTVNLKLNIKGLAIVTRDLEYIVEKGKFEIMVGRNTKEYLKDILSAEENIKF